MNIAALMGVSFVLLFPGASIVYSLCLSAVLHMALFMDVLMIVIGQQALKGADSFVLMTIPFFVIAGGPTESGGISKRIVSLARTVVGHPPGGLAIVTVIASMISATMVDAGAVTTAAAGGIMTPSMQEEGYDGGCVGAVQAVGEIFGPLIPPSIPMVLYGAVSGESVGDMLLAGLVPSPFLGVIVTAVVVWQCIKKGYKRAGYFSLKRVAKSFSDIIWVILVPAIILGGIHFRLFTPVEAFAVACFYRLITGLLVYRELNSKPLGKVVFKPVKTAAGIMLIVAVTQAFGRVPTRAGIPQMVAEELTSVVSSLIVFMFAVVFILIIVECFIDAAPVLLIFAPILIPIATQYGTSLIHSGVVMVVTLCIGLVTSPVGISLFVASFVGGQPIHKIIPRLPVLIASIMAGTIAIVLMSDISTLLPTLVK